MGPLIRVINPSIRDLSASADAVFHNLLVVAMVERHPKEALKVALNLLGTGQLSLTKVTVLVREDVPVRSFPRDAARAVVPVRPGRAHAAAADRAARHARLHSYELHVGSKLVLDATGPARTTEAPPTAISDPSAFDRRITRHKVLDGGFVVVR